MIHLIDIKFLQLIMIVYRGCNAVVSPLGVSLFIFNFITRDESFFFLNISKDELSVLEQQYVLIFFTCLMVCRHCHAFQVQW